MTPPAHGVLPRTPMSIALQRLFFRPASMSPVASVGGGEPLAAGPKPGWGGSAAGAGPAPPSSRPSPGTCSPPDRRQGQLEMSAEVAPGRTRGRRSLPRHQVGPSETGRSSIRSGPGAGAGLPAAAGGAGQAGPFGGALHRAGHPEGDRGRHPDLDPGRVPGGALVRPALPGGGGGGAGAGDRRV